MALVLVLWIVTLLSVIAASFSLGVRRDAGVAHHLVQATQAQAAAEAGIRIAMLGLVHPEPEERWQPGEGPRVVEWGMPGSRSPSRSSRDASTSTTRRRRCCRAC